MSIFPISKAKTVQRLASVSQCFYKSGYKKPDVKGNSKNMIINQKFINKQCMKLTKKDRERYKKRF